MSHADAIIASLGVEHRKRTTIGVELVAKVRLYLGIIRRFSFVCDILSPASFSWMSLHLVLILRALGLS